ncbi:hypothetical protein SORBI_3003G204501 [Sorghum bicolor]|uniref:Arabinogalactan peptide 22 n=3 Tax=Andropogoneae TaxID=147429 RepID=A0A1W0VY96_SORBI|nr:hypothetical protein SORBI_3003G204501 [Sorghum bicolor]
MPYNSFASPNKPQLRRATAFPIFFFSVFSSCELMASVKAYVLLFTAFFFSGLMQLSMAQDKQPAAARVIDAKGIDQAIAYLLMFAALFVTYFAH